MKDPANPSPRLGIGLFRVSTDRQFQEGESIETQQRKAEFVARRDRIDIVRLFVEHYSGRKTDRRVMDEMFAFLKENPDIEVVIVGDIDRFTRGGSEVYLRLRRELRELNVDLVDTTGIIQPERNRLEHLGVEYDWAVDSPSRFAEVFMAEKARTEGSDILVRTIGQQIQLTREGYQVRPANYGYRNVKVTIADGTRKTIMEPHPEEAIFVRRIFELRAEGIVSDKQIAQHVNAMGYCSRGRRIFDQATRKVIGHTGQKPMTPMQVQRIVRKPIYCGIRLDAWNDGKPVEAPIEPIVPVSLFNRANRGAVEVRKSQSSQIQVLKNPVKYASHRHNPDFLLRHVVACDHCGKPFLASKSRGKAGTYFGYYHCGRGHAYLGVNKAEFEATVANVLDGLVAKPGFLGLFREIVREVWIEKNRRSTEAVAEIDRHIRALKIRQNALIDRLTASQSEVVIRRLEQEIEDIEATILDASRSREQAGLTAEEIDAFFEIAKSLLEHPREAVMKAPTKERLEKIWGFIFAKRPSLSDLVNRTPSLTLIYRHSRRSDLSKEQMVGRLSADWNTFETEVRAAQGLEFFLFGEDANVLAA